MGAQHGVDRLAWVARFFEVFEEAGLQVCPVWDVALLVVANTGIDDDAAITGVDDQCMDAHDQPSILIGEVGLQPRQFLCRLLGGVGQDELGIFISWRNDVIDGRS